MPKTRFAIVFAVLLAGTALACMGPSDARVNLNSVLSLWFDTARDADQIGLKLTRMSDEEEMQLGRELSQSMLASYPEDPIWSRYVDDVAQPLLAGVRRKGIRYQFHVIDTPMINAFAMPGGQIFVTTGLLNFVESEAELAAVVGHEMSHVDLRHCVERFQYEYKLKKAGMADAGWMVTVAHQLATLGFTPYQESEADASGERLAVEAGYDPDAAATLFKRMSARFGEPASTRATTPGAEVGQAAGEAIGSYFRSHPPSADRARQLSEMVAEHRSSLAGKSFYIGKQNLHRRIARIREQFPGETREL